MTLLRRSSFLVALAATSVALSACGSDVTPSPSGTGGAGPATGPTSTASGGGEGGAGGGEEEDELIPAPGGMRRLLPDHVRQSIAVFLGDPAADAIEYIPEVASLGGFAAIGASELTMSSNDVSEFETLAVLAAEAAVANRGRLAELAPCAGQPEPASACYGDVASRVGRVAWRRPLEEAERTRLVQLADAGRAWATRQGLPDAWGQGLKYQLMAMIQSPNFLYMVEVGEPDEATGTRKLDAYELAARVSFFLHGRTPTPALLDAAEAGDLDTPEGVRALAISMLASEEARNAIDFFYAELFALDSLSSLSKDAELYPDFTPELTASMREETRLFLRDLVWERRGDAREMFVSEETFVDADLAALYGVQGPAEGFARATLPAGQQRSGLLGQASFLAQFAHPANTSPTRRGKFVSSRILCEEVPPPPPGVSPTLPEEVEGPQTMREKLTAHMEDPSCAGCHVYMDPMGLTFEHFDALGEWRPDDRGLPLDTSGESEGLGSFSGPRELGELIYEDERVPTCMVKNFLRASLGHLETSGERGEIRRMSDNFQADGHDVQDLIVELCASPLFRYVGDPK